MNNNRFYLSLVFTFLGFLISACGPSQGELDAIATQTAQAEELSTVKADLERSQAEVVLLSQKLEAGVAELQKTRKELEAMQQLPFFIGPWHDIFQGTDWYFIEDGTVEVIVGQDLRISTWTMVDSEHIAVDMAPLFGKDGDPSQVVTYSISNMFIMGVENGKIYSFAKRNK